MTRRNATRLSLLVALCLVLGATTTVGVAWFFSRHDAKLAPRSWAARDISSEEGGGVVGVCSYRALGSWLWSAERQSGEAGLLQDGERVTWDRVAPQDVRGRLVPWMLNGGPWPDRGQPIQIAAFAFGWPAPALACARRDLEDGSSWVGLLGGQELEGGVPGLPVQILPLGFVENASITTVLWSVAFMLPPAIRRRLRRRHARCPTCGYDLKGSPAGPCPECGHGAPS